MSLVLRILRSGSAIALAGVVLAAASTAHAQVAQPSTAQSPQSPQPPQPEPVDPSASDPPPRVLPEVIPLPHMRRPRPAGYYEQRRQDERGQRPYFGGLAYGSVGFVSGGFSAMQRLLQQPSILGQGFDTAPVGLSFGGGLGGLWDRVWIGGKLSVTLVDTADSQNGKTSLSGVGGGGELGYAAVARREWLMIPFFGVGGFGYDLSLRNRTAGPLTLFTGHDIAAGAERKYTSSFVTGEVGLRAVHLLGSSADSASGGLMIGAEIGYMASLQRTAWESGGAGTPESSELRAAYVRLLVGGDLFLFRGR